MDSLKTFLEENHQTLRIDRHHPHHKHIHGLSIPLRLSHDPTLIFQFIAGDFDEGTPRSGFIGKFQDETKRNLAFSEDLRASLTDYGYFVDESLTQNFIYYKKESLTPESETEGGELGNPDTKEFITEYIKVSNTGYIEAFKPFPLTFEEVNGEMIGKLDIDSIQKYLALHQTFVTHMKTTYFNASNSLIGGMLGRVHSFKTSKIKLDVPESLETGSDHLLTHGRFLFPQVPFGSFVNETKGPSFLTGQIWRDAKFNQAYYYGTVQDDDGNDIMKWLPWD